MKTFLHEFWIFGMKQAWACLFGGLILALIIGTKIYYPLESIARYDFLFIGVILIQLFLVIFKLESWSEVKVIFLFHIVGTIMEVFKTSAEIGSWSYPEESFFHIGNVPLFTGFMYSAVGSYIARSWSIMKLSYTNMPKNKYLIPLSILIYANFFTHHYIQDFRLFLFIAIFILFFKTTVYFKVTTKNRNMPMLLAFFLIAFFIWVAENVGTFSQTWIYPNQREVWSLVSLQKLGSWYLLMIISFVMVLCSKSKKQQNLISK